MTRKYIFQKAGQIQRTAGHIRECLGSQDELRLLGRSYLTRPLQPIICRATPEGTDGLPLEVLDGNRRLEGVLLEGGPDAEVPVCVTDEPLSDAVTLEIQMESAIHTRGLSAYEEFRGASRWLAMNPGATAEQLSGRIGRTPSMLVRVLSLSRCIPAVQDVAKAGLLGVSEWYEFAKCSERQQHEMLAARTAGAADTRDALARLGRQKRATRAGQVKQARVVCPLTTGTRIVVTGPEMSLEDLIAALQQALEVAKRASKDQIDIRTAEKVWRDRSMANVGATRD